MPGQWPPRDLFERDIVRAPLLSPFATGSGVNKWTELVDTPSSFTGQDGKVPLVNATEDGLEFGSAGGFTPDNTFFVQADGELTSFDDVAYTTVQDALDAANALTPSVTNQYVVRVAPGVYNEGSLTLYEFVHIQGMVTAAPTVDSSGEGAVKITLGTSTSGDLMNSVEHCVIEDVTFGTNGQTTQTDGINITHRSMVFRNVHFEMGQGNDTDIDALAGQFYNCTFYLVQVNVGGTISSAIPEFYSCRFGEDFQIFTVNSSSAAVFLGCYFEHTGGAQDVFIQSPNVYWQDCVFNSLSNNSAAVFIFEGVAIGCNFRMNQNPSLASQTVSLIKTAGGAQFIGCRFVFSGDDGNTGTEGCFEIVDLTAGDFIMTGCEIDRDDGSHSLPIFMLGTGITSSVNRIVLTGNSFADDDTQSGNSFIAIHSSGFTGEVVVELNGNHIRGPQTALPTNASTGKIRWRGSDIKTKFTPVSAEWGTGTAGENDNFPGVLLDAAMETAFVVERANPPAGINIDSALVLSAHNSDGIQIDAMTDSDSTDLSAHSPTSGTGTWTATAGTITIQSNAASCSASGINIYTYSIAGKNGYMRANPLAASATGVNSIGLLFRYADSSNYWRLVEVDEGSNLRLIKRVAGVETEVYTTVGTPHFGVSFNGPIIRVYEDVDGTPRLVAEIEDSDLEDNTTVGIYCGRFNGTHTLDDWEFHPGGDIDITIDTDQAHKHFPFNNGNEASADDDGVNVLHHAYSLHDFAGGENEELVQAKVTLDALNGNITQVYLHGVLTRYLAIVNTEHSASDTLQPRTGIIHR